MRLPSGRIGPPGESRTGLRLRRERELAEPGGEVQIERARPLWRDASPAELAGRLEAVTQERDTLRAEVWRLLEEQARWLALMQRVTAERDAARQREAR
jgi:hypothetical protein